MLKRILLYLTFLTCFFFVTSWYTYAETLQEKLLRLKMWSSEEVKDNQDVTIELKLEDVNKKDIYLPLKVVWKNEKWEWYWLKYFWLKSSLEAMSKTMPQNESHWKLYFSNAWEEVIESDFQIDLDYNKFNWTLREKRLLYYVQFEYNSDSKQYKFKRVYTQNDLEQEQKQDAEVRDISIKWEVRWEYPIMWVDVWLYDTEWRKIESTQSDMNWKYEIKIFDFQQKIQFWKTYYLIWQKQWNLENNIIWILSQWKEYKFKNTRDIISTFSWIINIDVKINEKDIVKSENFPFIFLVVLISLYIFIIYYIFKSTIQTVYVHPYSKKVTSWVVKLERKEKLERIKNNLNRKLW